MCECTRQMFKFGGFKASLDFSSRGKQDLLGEDATQHAISISGAYRPNREEFFGNGSLSNATQKKLTPSMINLPSSKHLGQTNPAGNSSKSSSNLVQTVEGTKAATEDAGNRKVSKYLAKSMPDISHNPRGGASSSRNLPRQSYALAVDPNKPKDELPNDPKEQKKIEKRLKEEQKKIAKEQAKQEKLRKKSEKAAAEERARRQKIRREKRRRAAEKQAREAEKQAREAEKQARQAEKQAKEAEKQAEKQAKEARKQMEKENKKRPANSENPLARRPQHTTNTLESSISKSSGPPPYSEVTRLSSVTPNKADNTGNTSFSKPVDTSASSWDMISQHRQQISRPTSTVQNIPKKNVRDLQYNVGSFTETNHVRNASDNDRDNSEA